MFFVSFLHGVMLAHVNARDKDCRVNRKRTSLHPDSALRLHHNLAITPLHGVCIQVISSSRKLHSCIPVYGDHKKLSWHLKVNRLFRHRPVLQFEC